MTMSRRAAQPPPRGLGPDRRGTGPGVGASTVLRADTGRATRVVGRAVLGCLAGAAALVAAPMTPVEAVVSVVGVVLIAASVLSAVAADRVTRRRELLLRLADAMSELVGRRGEGVRLTARGWSGGWTGTPKKLRIRYAGHTTDNDPAWVSTVLAACSRRLGDEKYRVAKHLPSQTLLVLTKVTSVSAKEEASPELQTRATAYLTQLMGPTAKVESVEWAEDDPGRLRAIEVSHQAGARLAASGYQRRVESVLNTVLPGRWRAQWDMEEDRVRFEVRPTMPGSVWLPATLPPSVEDLLSNYDKVRIAYGIDEDNEEIVWQPAISPQFLITGGTGSGKTSTLHAILAKVTQYGWPVFILDGKRVEFLRHRDWPNVQIVATTIEQQVALIHQVSCLVDERYRLMEEEGLQAEDFEPLIVVLDEWTEFVAELLDWYGSVKAKGDPTKPITLKQEASLARRARTARVHLLKTQQRPDVNLGGGQGGEVRSNYTQRLTVGRLDPQGAGMMWGNPSTGVTIPRGARQRGISTNEAGKPVEIQCYRFPSMTAPADSEQGQLRETLRPTESRHPRLLIVPPQVKLDLDGGPDTPLTFWDYASAEWVLATDRPDLDPVLRAERRFTSGEGRQASSTLAVLGLGGAADPGARLRSRLTGGAEYHEPTSDRGDIDTPAGVDRDEGYEGYQDPQEVTPEEIVVGDLIEVEQGSGEWVVVAEPVEDDLMEEGMVLVCWRGDDDSDGTVSVPEGGGMQVRRPEFGID